MDEEDLRREYAELLPRLRDLHTQLLTEIARATHGKEVEIRSRIKAWESIREKISRLEIARVSDILDLVGVRVVVPDADTLFEVTDAIAAEFLITSRQTSHLRPTESATHIAVRTSFTGGLPAEIQVITAAEEARRRLEHEIGYTAAKSAAARKEPDVVAPLSRVIDSFEELLDRTDVHEKRDVHPFIKAHDFLLFQSSDAVVSEVPIGLGTEYRIDFLVRRPDGTYILVEIENPKARVVTEGGELTHAVNHALCQVEDWQEWIETNLPTVEKYYPGMKAPEAWVIIGRDRDLDNAARVRIARRNINMRGHVTIRTYDDLIRDARAYARNIAAALLQPS